MVDCAVYLSSQEASAARDEKEASEQQYLAEAKKIEDSIVQLRTALRGTAHWHEAVSRVGAPITLGSGSSSVNSGSTHGDILKQHADEIKQLFSEKGGLEEISHLEASHGVTAAAQKATDLQQSEEERAAQVAVLETTLQAAESDTAAAVGVKVEAVRAVRSQMQHLKTLMANLKIQRDWEQFALNGTAVVQACATEAAQLEEQHKDLTRLAAYEAHASFTPELAVVDVARRAIELQVGAEERSAELGALQAELAAAEVAVTTAASAAEREQGKEAPTTLALKAQQESITQLRGLIRSGSLGKVSAARGSALRRQAYHEAEADRKAGLNDQGVEVEVARHRRVAALWKKAAGAPGARYLRSTETANAAEIKAQAQVIK